MPAGPHPIFLLQFPRWLLVNLSDSSVAFTPLSERHSFLQALSTPLLRDKQSRKAQVSATLLKQMQSFCHLRKWLLDSIFWNCFPFGLLAPFCASTLWFLFQGLHQISDAPGSSCIYFGVCALFLFTGLIENKHCRLWDFFHSSYYYYLLFAGEGWKCWLLQLCSPWKSTLFQSSYPTADGMIQMWKKGLIFRSKLNWMHLAIINVVWNSNSLLINLKCLCVKSQFYVIRICITWCSIWKLK